MDQIYKGTEEDRMEPYYYSKMNKVQQAAYHAIRQGLLEISDSSISISKTGATTVKAKASVRNKLFIFDNVPAVADGTIVAHIMENGHEVEAVNLVLPKYGVSTEVQLTGMTLSDRIHSSIPQTVTFSGNLWLMER